jgi:hypothetical protein
MGENSVDTNEEVGEVLSANDDAGVCFRSDPFGWTVTVRKGHSVVQPDNACGAAKKFFESISEIVFAFLGLVERVRDVVRHSPRIGREPLLPNAVEPNPTAFDLDDQNPVRWVRCHEVRLTIAKRIVVNPTAEPADIVEDSPTRWQLLVEQVVKANFRAKRWIGTPLLMDQFWKKSSLARHG